MRSLRTNLLQKFNHESNSSHYGSNDVLAHHLNDLTHFRTAIARWLTKQVD